MSAYLYHDAELLGKSRRLVPLKKTTPSMSIRYARNKKHTLRHLSFEVSIISVENSPSSNLKRDWEGYIHPEGLKYYRHRKRNIITDANLQDEAVLDVISQYIKELSNLLERLTFEQREYHEITLELTLEEDACNYYMIDHQRQTVFYPDMSETEELDLPEVASLDHLGLELQRQYWLHMEFFPMHKALPPSARSTLLGILHHAHMDFLTSNTSTSVQNAKGCKEFSDLVSKFTGEPEQRGYETCTIARLMDGTLRGRFVNYYGEANGARLARDEHVEDGTSVAEVPSYLFSCTSWLMFWQPKREHLLLQSISTDSVYYTEPWREFNKNHISEWKGISMVALGLTILNSLIVTRLQVSPVSEIEGNTLRLMAWHAGTISVLTSVSSLIVSLASINAHHSHCTSSAADAAVYFTRARHPRYGLQLLALVLGLPRGLLIWSLVTTGTSILAASLEAVEQRGAIIVGSIGLLLCILVLWAMRVLQFREDEESSFLAPLQTIIPGLPANILHRKVVYHTGSQV